MCSLTCCGEFSSLWAVYIAPIGGVYPQSGGVYTPSPQYPQCTQSPYMGGPLIFWESSHIADTPSRYLLGLRARLGLSNLGHRTSAQSHSNIDNSSFWAFPHMGSRSSAHSIKQDQQLVNCSRSAHSMVNCRTCFPLKSATCSPNTDHNIKGTCQHEGRTNELCRCSYDPSPNASSRLPVHPQPADAPRTANASKPHRPGTETVQ